jgi:hypothetical protein
MPQAKPRTAFAVTRSLERAKARYPWAKAWVQVRGRIWCFESVQEARLFQPQTNHEFLAASEPKPKWPLRRKR